MQEKKRSADNNILSGVIAILFFVLGAIIYFWAYKKFPPYFVNDSGVEILQVIDFEPWPLKAFIPSYKSGLVVMIESFYGYWMQPFLWLLGNDIAVFRLALGIVFSLTGALFYICLKRIFNAPTAILVTVAYITSAYTIWWPLLLLRNAFCPLLLICMLLGLLDLLDGKSRRGFFILILSSFIAINTYSTFKIVVPSVFISALLAGFFTCANKSFIKKISLAGVMLAALVTVFFIYAHVNTELLLRGSYMFADTDISVNKDLKTYLLFALRSFSLPLYQDPAGFLAEPTHLTFGRSMLNPWLYGGWLLGLGILFLKIVKKDTVAFISLAILILSSLLLCVGGPSLKTHFALAPLEFIVVAYGVYSLLQISFLKKLMPFILGAYIIFVGYLENRYMYTTVKSANVNVLDAIGQDVGLYLTKRDKDFDFVVYASYGVDLMRVFYANHPSKTEMAPYFDEPAFNSVLNRNTEQHKRVWIILTPESEFYTRLKNDGVFCYETTIAGKIDAALFVPCEKK